VGEGEPLFLEVASGGGRDLAFALRDGPAAEAAPSRHHVRRQITRDHARSREITRDEARSRQITRDEARWSEIRRTSRGVSAETPAPRRSFASDPCFSPPPPPPEPPAALFSDSAPSTRRDVPSYRGGAGSGGGEGGRPPRATWPSGAQGGRWLCRAGHRPAKPPPPRRPPAVAPDDAWLSALSASEFTAPRYGLSPRGAADHVALCEARRRAENVRRAPSAGA